MVCNIPCLQIPLSYSVLYTREVLKGAFTVQRKSRFKILVNHQMCVRDDRASESCSPWGHLLVQEAIGMCRH